MSIFESDIAALLLKATLLLLVAVVTRRILMRASAATRHLTLVFAMCGLLLLPLLAVGLPVWQLEVLPAKEMPASDRALPAPVDAETWVGEASGFPVEPWGVTAPALSDLPPAAGGLRLSVTGWLLTLWAAGAALVLAKLSAGLLRMRWIARHGERVTDPAALRMLDECVNLLGLGVRPLLIASEKAGVPLVWGWLRPALLVPGTFSRWAPDRMRAVMLHELGHLQRHDWPVLLLGRITAALYWFHPLAWMVEKRAKQECEQACDDIVIRYGTKPSEYASHLLSIARDVSETPASVRAALAVVRRSQLNSRLRSILNPVLSRKTPSRALAAGLGTALLMVLVPFASLQFAEVAHADEPQWKERNRMHDHGEMHDDHDHDDGKEMSEAARANKVAYKLHSKGRYEEARAAFEDALELGHERGATLYNIACCEAMTGNADGAMRYLEKAFEAGFDNVTNLVQDSDFDPIRSDVAFQGFIDARFEKAGVERQFPQHYRYRATMEKLQELQQTESQDGKAWHATGYKLLGLGEHELAVDAFTQAIAAMGKNASTAMYNLACSQSLAGNERQALVALEQAVDAGFDQHERFINDSDLDNLRDSSEFERIKKKNEFLSLGRFPGRDWEESPYSVDRWAPAIEEYRTYVGDSPSSGRGWFNLGWALHHSERFDEAIGAFEKAVALDYRTETSSYNIACGNAKLNRTGAALDALAASMASGAIGYGQLEHDEDLDSLRGDERFRSLLAEAKEKQEAEERLHLEKKMEKKAREKAASKLKAELIVD